MNLHMIKFTSMDDVIKYKYNEKTLELSLAFKATTDSQTRSYVTATIADRILGLRTGVLYCEGKTIDAPDTCDLARFHTLSVHSNIVDYSNVANAKSQLLRAFTFLQRVKDGDLTKMSPYDKRAFTNRQYRNV